MLRRNPCSGRRCVHGKCSSPRWAAGRASGSAGGASTAPPASRAVYFSSTPAPASSSSALSFSASSFAMPSFTCVGGAVDDVLGLLETEAGRRAHDLDHLDLLVAGGREDDVEGVLLLSAAAPRRPPGAAATATGAAAVTPHSSSIAFFSSTSSSTVIPPSVSSTFAVSVAIVYSSLSVSDGAAVGSDSSVDSAGASAVSLGLRRRLRLLCLRLRVVGDDLGGRLRLRACLGRSLGRGRVAALLELRDPGVDQPDEVAHRRREQAHEPGERRHDHADELCLDDVRGRQLGERLDRLGVDRAPCEQAAAKRQHLGVPRRVGERLRDGDRVAVGLDERDRGRALEQRQERLAADLLAARRVSVFLTTWNRAPLPRSFARSSSSCAFVSPR